MGQPARALPDPDFGLFEPMLAAIRRLKAERHAIVLGHNYMTPEIYYGIADVRGDSLALAQRAAEAEADVIVVAGVHFMAETVKLVAPGKTVLIPDREAGCSLAEAITADDVALLREAYPGVPVVTYVNTSAAVKAASDICCTSGNAVEVVESLGAERVIFLPDEYLGRWVASQTEVEIIPWRGHCEVHQRFTGGELRAYRADYPDIRIIAHPECPPDVLVEADYVGSTAGMQRWVETNRPRRVVMITECSMSDNVAIACPDVEFVRPCNLCPHMKRITLEKILASLRTLTHEVQVPPDTAEQARRAVQRMLDLRPPPPPLRRAG